MIFYRLWGIIRGNNKVFFGVGISDLVGDIWWGCDMGLGIRDGVVLLIIVVKCFLWVVIGLICL